MTAFFTDFFRAQLTANPNLLNPGNVRVVLWRTAPSMEGGVAPYVGVRTVAELEALPGWAEVSGIAGYPFATRSVAVSTRTAPAGSPNRYVTFTQYPFIDMAEPVGIEAVGVQYIGTVGGQTNPLIMVTNTPTGLFQNVYPADALTAQPDLTPGRFPDATNRWLLGWAVPTGGAQIAPVEGPLAMFKGAPAYEAANTQHVWLYPQRANMVANPSFEAPGVGYWSSEGAITRVAGGAPDNGVWHGNFAGKIAESNVFPTLQGDMDHEAWTIQLMAKGTGPCKVGLVYWDRDYRLTGVDWGEETWQLQTGAWTHIACLRQGYQAHTAMVRIETQTASFKIDQVIAERGYLKDWPYFDGDEKYGAGDSYCWYNGMASQGASYSLWYGNRRAVMGRLFATDTDMDDPDVLTDEDVAKWGLVYQWVPAGVQVIPHICVFYPGDLRAPVPPKDPGVLPYYNVSTQPLGVINPWV